MTGEEMLSRLEAFMSEEERGLFLDRLVEEPYRSRYLERFASGARQGGRGSRLWIPRVLLLGLMRSRDPYGPGEDRLRALYAELPSDWQADPAEFRLGRI